MDLAREQWMLAQCLVGAVNACNAPFCGGEDEAVEAVNADPEYIDKVAKMVAKQTSVFALEDTIEVLDKALGYATEDFVSASGVPSARRTGKFT